MFVVLYHGFNSLTPSKIPDSESHISKSTTYNIKKSWIKYKINYVLREHAI